MRNQRVGVLGAGIVGLTTALELQREFPSLQITLIADKFNNETTSSVAAGIFRPASSFEGISRDITSQWIQDSYYFYDGLCQSVDSSAAGVTQVSGYQFSSTSPEIVRNPYLEHLLPVYRSATEEELRLCPGNWLYGSFYTTLLTECYKFLPWALDRFKLSGGKVLKKIISSFSDVADYDVLINCFGMGARNLCSDYKLVPIRGQIIKVQAPWIKTFFYADYDTYVIPGSKAVTLGGCRQYESYDLSINPHDKAAIHERCVKLLPSLKNARVVADAVGLRPHRSTVRVETEIKDTGSEKIKIIHNYGHGGYGVTAAPGTAKYAVKLFRELHSAGLRNKL
ncbi:hypothetical protein R5R35_000399 [Gryllus longicercus]|uniref:FAD dependent oxidoreductase domain-containing protein n=1 Tax=Gryllus longicercus TaxID=2509291 RepID=A0AAN9VAM8_9ORTH|nr:D-aspartate oxidase [Gryllus bimaculatus]